MQFHKDALIGKIRNQTAVIGVVGLGKVGAALNDRGKAIKGSKVLVLGIAYKKNVDDTRESPSVALMELLLARHAKLIVDTCGVYPEPAPNIVKA
ncbi:MAG: hypothetical protein AUJ86_02375 [Hydrogenophilaceae bacterium CG1_02_62_390]|nr:MAG: hypothetical protein AUJ86_02375 [Hydrogenophilaceae bacterium CG1_02_62_390]